MVIGKLIELKKIILTDNEDLIKDDVQKIDDEFLEWFIKNPSCERVEILETPKLVKMIDNEFYKIIIPSKEFEQEERCPSCGNPCNIHTDLDYNDECNDCRTI